MARVFAAAVVVVWAWTNLHPLVGVVGVVVLGTWTRRAWVSARRAPGGGTPVEGRSRHASGATAGSGFFEVWLSNHVDLRVLPPHAWMERGDPRRKASDAGRPPSDVTPAGELSGGEAAELLSLAPPSPTMRGTTRDDGSTITLVTAAGTHALAWEDVDHHVVLASPSPADAGIAIVFVTASGDRRCLIVDDPEGRWHDELLRRGVPGPPV